MGVTWTAVAEDLLAMPAAAMSPPYRLGVVALALGFEEPGSLLVVGDPLPLATQRKLWPQLAVRNVSSLGEALEAMDAHKWKLVVVSTRVREGTDGLRFVRTFKTASLLEGVAEPLRRRYRRVPFLIQPLADDTQFAIFKTAHQWYLTDTRELSLLEAIRRWCR